MCERNAAVDFARHRTTLGPRLCVLFDDSFCRIDASHDFVVVVAAVDDAKVDALK